MAEAETNPVLQVINPGQTMEENTRYPAGLLNFNNLGWRAYYHCHPASRKGNHNFKGEHGHFHLFIKIQDNPDTWSHLAALAMDNMGQPLGWFCVNQWVTGESWQDKGVLLSHLHKIPYKDQSILVERWLLSLLSLESENIAELLNQRDEALNKFMEQEDINSIKKNKDIYLLSEVKIDLNKTIMSN